MYLTRVFNNGEDTQGEQGIDTLKYIVFYTLCQRNAERKQPQTIDLYVVHTTEIDDSFLHQQERAI